jgi:hypothetical protein
MFQFTGLAPFGDMSSTCRVTPFGNPYLNDYLHLSYDLLYLLPVRQRTSFLVENIGVEPMTSCVQGRRSSQLS